MRCLLGILVLAGTSLAYGAEAPSKPDNTRIFCTARTIFEKPVSGGRCIFSDEVMTGIQSLDPLVIRCARLDVDCRSREVEPVQD